MPLASISKVTSICGTPRGARRNAGQAEAAQRLVVSSHLTLALQDMNLNLRLAVRSGGEYLALFASGWWCYGQSDVVNTPPMVSIPRDKRGNIQQQQRP